MSTPDYLICLNCDSPTYVFEWNGEVISEATCEVCGNDDNDEFLDQFEYEELTESSWQTSAR